MTNKIKLVQEHDNQPEKDFKAELAALINANAAKKHPNVKLLELVSERLLKITDELVATRNQYLKIHNLLEPRGEAVPYDIGLTEMGITNAVHECHKVISYLEKELRQAKA